MSLTSLRLLLLALGAAFVLGTAAALRFFAQSDTLPTFAQSYLQPGLGGVSLEAEGVVVVGHDGGRRRWRMVADAATFSRDQRSASVRGIRRGVFLDNTGRPTVSVTADRAEFASPFGGLASPGMGVLTLSGGVRAAVLSPRRPVLRAGTLVWNVARSELSSPGPLSVALPRLSVAAGGATYDAPPGRPDAGVLRLSGGVRALVRGAHGLTTLSCPGLVWDSRAQTAHSLGPVSAAIPGGLGSARAADVVVDTKTGSLQGHGFQGTLGVGAAP